MPLTEEERRLSEIFFSHELKQRDEVEARDGRFVHYTTAETAMSIIQTKFVWMRNAITMNDFSEVEYGANCLFEAYKDADVGGALKIFLNELYPGFSDELERRFISWLPHFRHDTYLISLSEHDVSEDVLGRLSMWRAYGGTNGVALVLNNHPFMQAGTNLGAYSSPVSYATPAEFAGRLADLTRVMIRERELLAGLGIEALMSNIFAMFRFSILCSKHPGFREEREWRILYSPTFERSEIIQRDFAVVRGIPQEIYKMPLVHNEAAGLIRADIPNLLNRIIVGPTQQPLTMYKAFVSLLTQAGVADAARKVVVSEIPLRG